MGFFFWGLGLGVVVVGGGLLFPNNHRRNSIYATPAASDSMC